MCVKRWEEDFPGGPVIGNLPASARDVGSIPGPEDSTCYGATKSGCQHYWARVLQLLKPAYSTVAITTHTSESVLCTGRGHHNEKTAYRNKE